MLIGEGALVGIRCKAVAWDNYPKEEFLTGRVKLQKYG